jgi:ParB family chromosome partitioning protein
MEKQKSGPAVNAAARSEADGNQKRKRLDDLLKQGAVMKSRSASSSGIASSLPGTELIVLPFSLMDDFPGHPFRLYEGECKTDMIDSIREKGILQPLILREMDDGRYQVLSGHNRKYCGIEAGLSDTPAIIKRGLSDDEAWMFVIETNLIQRSFADMLPSEQAAVLFTHYTKMFSQGKRNDIKDELKKLENPQNYWEYETCAQLGHKSKSRDVLAEKYGLSRNTVARFLRVHQLIPAIKARLDANEIAFIPAVTLSFLKEREQRLVDKCIALNGFSVDVRKSNVLRDYSGRGRLDEEKIYLILNSELGQPPKKNRTPTVKVNRTLYAKFFQPSQSAREIQDYVERALCFYHEYQNNRNKRRNEQIHEPSDDDTQNMDIDEDEDWLEQ